VSNFIEKNYPNLGYFICPTDQNVPTNMRLLHPPDPSLLILNIKNSFGRKEKEILEKNHVISKLGVQ
jgi:hypothetical protein